MCLPACGNDTTDFMRASPSSRQEIRVLLAETNSIHAELLARAIARDRHLHVVYSTSEASEIAKQVAQLQPDVVILSASLEGNPEGGFEVLDELRGIAPELKLIVLLERSVPDKVVRAFRSGARGVFSRTSPVKELSKCIRVVHEGQIWANTAELGFVLQALAGASLPRALSTQGIGQLSNRERDVVRCLVEGMSNREIAQKLSISPYTVKNYVFKIFERLGVSSRVELLFYVMSQSANPNPCAWMDGGLKPEGAAQAVPLKQQPSPSHPAKTSDMGLPIKRIVNSG